MKIAVLTDIHANYIALETVYDHLSHWHPDLVLVAGDTVNRGPRSQDCLQFVLQKEREEGWILIRGNHEEYVIDRAHPADPKSGPLYDMYLPVHFTYQQLNRDISDLTRLPEMYSFVHQQKGEVRMAHASMHGNRDGVYPETRTAELRRKIAPPPAVFVTGHTHRPFVCWLDGSLVINAGSVGLPFDGDTRPSYAQITHLNGQWRGEIIRLPYDLQQAERDFITTGFLDQAGPLAELIILELRWGYSQLFQWSSIYADPILKGLITVEEATREFLHHPIRRPYW